MKTKTLFIIGSLARERIEAAILDRLSKSNATEDQIVAEISDAYKAESKKLIEESLKAMKERGTIGAVPINQNARSATYRVGKVLTIKPE